MATCHCRADGQTLPAYLLDFFFFLAGLAFFAAFAVDLVFDFFEEKTLSQLSEYSLLGPDRTIGPDIAEEAPKKTCW